jgi:hypothetical protein
MYGILRGSGLILVCKMPNVFDDKIPVPLDLEGIRVVRYEVDERGDYLLYAESTATFEICHKCDRIITYKHGLDKPITVRHLDILGFVAFGVMTIRLLRKIFLGGQANHLTQRTSKDIFLNN